MQSARITYQRVRVTTDMHCGTLPTLAYPRYSSEKLMNLNLVRFSRRLCSLKGRPRLFALFLWLWPSWGCQSGRYILSLYLRQDRCVEFKIMKVCLFLILPVSTHTMPDRGIQTFDEDLVNGKLFIHVSTPEYFLHQFFSLLGQRHF